MRWKTIYERKVPVRNCKNTRTKGDTQQHRQREQKLSTPSSRQPGAEGSDMMKKSQLITIGLYERRSEFAHYRRTHDATQQWLEDTWLICRHGWNTKNIPAHEGSQELHRPASAVIRSGRWVWRMKWKRNYFSTWEMRIKKRKKNSKKNSTNSADISKIWVQNLIYYTDFFVKK